MLGALGRFVVRRRMAVLVAALLTMVVAGAVGGGVAQHLTGGGFEDPGAESAQARELLEDTFGARNPNVVLLVTSADGSVDSAAAAAAGTAFLLCPEAGTSEVHRRALASDAPTALTRAFTGRLARGIRNRFMAEHDGFAPSAYPEVHHMTAPLRAAGREAGDPDVVNLWAGQAHALAREAPAAEVVRALSHTAGA